MYVGLRKSAKLTNGLRAVVSALKNITPTTTAIAPRPNVIGFVQPISLPWVASTCNATIVTMNVRTPIVSKR